MLLKTYRVIENFENNFRVIDENGEGICTCYHKEDADDFVEFLIAKENKYKLHEN